METNEIQGAGTAPACNRLTKKQWTAVTAVSGAAAIAAGPIAAAGAAIGMLGGCYVSNRMGWSDI